jgi:hypothetical protein
MSNPYQIRTDVMSMAKEMLDKTYDTQMTLAYTVMNQYKGNAEQALDLWNTYVPKMYTPEELKKQAETLYEFVSNDKKSK